MAGANMDAVTGREATQRVGGQRMPKPRATKASAPSPRQDERPHAGSDEEPRAHEAATAVPMAAGFGPAPGRADAGMRQQFQGEHSIANRLLLALPRATLIRLAPAMKLVDLARGESIGDIDQPVAYGYFVNRGLVSLVKTMGDGRTVEIGAVGIEGITDPLAMTGDVDTALMDSIVQIPGAAFRIRHDVLLREFKRDAALRSVIRRYVKYLASWVIQTAACNRFHSVEERCCRWLLTAQDSALSDAFPLTHEFLAMMLGVRRPGISTMARSLYRDGLIRYRHGIVTMIDRKGLEARTCECYADMHHRLDELFGRPMD
jgi:CRP-like cAMP-binding protein